MVPLAVAAEFALVQLVPVTADTSLQHDAIYRRRSLSSLERR
jgi:hypothetical protein